MLLLTERMIRLRGRQVFKGETRRLERIFKLTADSLIILDGDKIKKETHYAGLERVSLDPVDATSIWVKLKVRLLTDFTHLHIHPPLSLSMSLHMSFSH